MQNRKHLLELMRGFFENFHAKAHPDFETHSSQPSIALTFQYNDLRLRLLHSEESPHIRNLALIECRLGPVAPADEESQYEQLLDLNYRLCATNAAFAIDAEGGDILYTCAFVVDSMDTGALIRLLEGIEPIYAQWPLTGLAAGDAAADTTAVATPIGPEFPQA